MSNRNRITWTDNQDAKLRKAVKNFNAKITRLERKYPEIKSSLPERVSVKELKSIIGTRYDLDRETERLKRFSSRRGAETIVTPPAKYGNTHLKLTSWELKEMERMTSKVNRERAKELEKVREIQRTSRGQDLGYTRGEEMDKIVMDGVDVHTLQPINPFTPEMNTADKRAKFRTLRKEYAPGYWENRNEIVKKAYIKSLEDNYGPENVKDVVSRINEMSADEFRTVFESEGGTKLFEWSYPQHKSSKSKRPHQDVPDADKEMQDHLKAVHDIWLQR